MQTARLLLFAVTLIASACSPGSSMIEAQGPAEGIIGGTPVAASDPIAKHIVLLRSKRATARQFCTGTLIRPDVVLTAAHCVVSLKPSLQTLETNDDFEVVFSTDAMTRDSSRVRRPREVLIHPQFLRMSTLCQLNRDAIGCDSFTRIPWTKLPPKEDLALIRLDSLAPADTQPAKLARQMPPSPVPLIISGGGLRGELKSPYTTYEQARSLSGRLDQFTKSVYFTWNPFRAEKRGGWRTSNGEICIEETAAQSTAPGDSGGPLFVSTNAGIELLGVYSTMTRDPVYDGRKMERLACYMDLLKSREWIDRILADSLSMFKL